MPIRLKAYVGCAIKKSGSLISWSVGIFAVGLPRKFENMYAKNRRIKR